MNIKNDLCVEIRPEFQKRVFSELIKKYGGSTNLSKVLPKSASMLRNYKQCRSRNISLSILTEAINLAGIAKEELEKNIIRKFSKNEEIERILKEGREIRKAKIKELFNSNVLLNEILKENENGLELDIVGWFSKTNWLNKIKKQVGIIRNIREIKRDRELVIQYEVYNKRTIKFEKHIIVLPEKMKIDEDFLYFLGLRYGDGSNGARVGIVNKNINLIEWTANFLRRIMPKNKVRGDIYVYKKEVFMFLDKLKADMENIVDYLGIYDLTNKERKGVYVLYVYLTNEFFNRIYNNIVEQMDILFKKLNIQQKGAFLAGFFDAEGNVNKRDKNFRWSQKTPHKVKMIKDLLKKEGYHLRYDGSNLIIGHKKEIWKEDLERFKEQVLPHIKHPDKRKEAKELLEGYYVMDTYKKIAKIIQKNEGINSQQIAQVAKRMRCHRELTALTEAGFLVRTRKRVDESFKYGITEKGYQWITRSD